MLDDLNNNQPGDEFDPVAALLSRWEKPDAKGPSDDQKKEENVEDHDETDDHVDENEQDESEQEEQDETDPQEEADGDEDEGEVSFASDDAKVRVSVDGAEHEVSVKDLKRLWGQEASLTRKSQEVAEQRKVIDTKRSQYETALNTMYQKAVERAKPYAQIDFALAAKNLSSEDYAALKKDAQTAFEEVRYFEQEMTQHVERQSKEAQESHKKAAEEAVKQITDESSPFHIPGWSEDVYADLREYGVKMGIPREVMDNSTSAPSFKILWMAQQYEKGKQVATQKKTKVVGKKTLNAKGPKETGDDRVIERMNRLKKSGSVDDAATVLLERWVG